MTRCERSFAQIGKVPLRLSPLMLSTVDACDEA